MQYHVYVMWSESLAKTYVGFTSDLEARVISHNTSPKGWTVRGRPWKLIYSEQFSTKRAAMERESYLKTGSGREFIKRHILQTVAGSS